MDVVADHEAALTGYALQRLTEVPGIKIYGDTDPDRASTRLGVIPLNIKGLSHFLVAAILGHEFGIGVRSGCFCAHPYILHLLKLNPTEATALRNRMLAGDKSEMPGMVRASFGLYNSTDDIEALVEALTRIAQGKYTGIYHQDRSSGEFKPEGWNPIFDQYFSL